MRERQFRLVPLSLVIVLVIAIQGCFSVKLVSEYDEQTDRAITDLYRAIVVYMADLQNRTQVGGADSLARAARYDNIRVDIEVLKFRVSTKDKNQQQIQQVEVLTDSWGKIDQLQKLNPPREAIENAQSGLETTLTAILKLEEAKKQR